MLGRLVLVLVLCLGLTGCGQDAPKAPIPKEKYELIWQEITQVMVKRKGTVTRKDQESILKKHSVTAADWQSCVDVYGMSDEIREAQRKAFESNAPTK